MTESHPIPHASWTAPPENFAGKQSLRSVAWNLFLITAGSLLFAVGSQAVLVHHEFIIGGLYGTALFLYYKTQWLSPGVWYLLFNIPVMIIGWLFFSRRFFLYSLYAVCILSFFVEILHLDFEIRNQLYAAIAGGAICGTGSGIILRSTGSGGGLDVIAIILNRRYNLGIGKFFMMFNVLLFTVVASQYEADLVIASIILTFISSFSLEQVLAMFNQRKIVYILSDKNDEIVQSITFDMHQGATLIEARGAYSGQDRQLIMTITNNLQLTRLEDQVFSIDPDALFIAENSFRVIGSNFGKRKMY